MFAWQGFESKGIRGVASVRSCEKASPHPRELIPVGSKIYPRLAISNRSSNSGIRHLRREKIPSPQKQLFKERRENIFSLSHCDLIGNKLK